MADEKPLSLVARKRTLKHKDSHIICIIHCCQTSERVTSLTDTSFAKIQETSDIHKKYGDTDELESIIRDLPDTYIKKKHGYHRKCYQKFTNVSRLLKRKSNNDSSTEPSRSKRRRVATDETVLFPSDKCLFCDKSRKKMKGKEESLSKCETETADYRIKSAAVECNDFSIQAKVNETDLVAWEAKYHMSCYKAFTRSESRNVSQTPTCQKSKNEQKAHAAAFTYLSEYIQDSIIKRANVERLSMLKEKYLMFIQSNYPDHYNSNYKTYKLKQKIQKHFGPNISFWQPNYRSELVYSSSIPQGHAVETAFEAAASDHRRLEEVAMLLRRIIIAAKQDAPDLPWPIPLGHHLKNLDVPPKEVLDFICQVIYGCNLSDGSTGNERIVHSISRDLLYAVTKGRWMTSKHIMLGMSLWHLTGRADIVTLVNRFGHCVSYSKLLEILTGIQISIQDHNSPIPPGIKMTGNEIIHFCWDNFDLNEETPSGAGTTHSTHGIVIQERSEADHSEDEDRGPAVIIDKNKQRSAFHRDTVLEPCFVKGRPDPVLNAQCSGERNILKEFSNVAKASDATWVLCRSLSVQHGNQSVPDWGGWVSLTGKKGQEPISKVEYMPPINAPITDNSTVMHVLHISQEATDAVGQPFTFVTFDLAAAKKAYDIIWTYPQRFHNVIVLLGAFHMACTFMGAIGKMMRGSGLEEVLIESQVCASGSLEKVLNGKHYNRGRYVIRTTLEALERLMWMSFIDYEGTHIDEHITEMLLHLGNSPSQGNLEAVLQDPQCEEIMQHYKTFQESIRQGRHGKTAQFWLGFVDKAWLLFRFLRATKENDLRLHIACLHEICPMFFSQGKHNYARYTAMHLHALLNLPTTHPGVAEVLEKNGLSVNRSEVPNSRNAIDITIEQTYNPHASGHGPGVIGFSRNFSAYHRWSTTRHARASHLQVSYRTNSL